MCHLNIISCGFQYWNSSDSWVVIWSPFRAGIPAMCEKPFIRTVMVTETNKSPRSGMKPHGILWSWKFLQILSVNNSWGYSRGRQYGNLKILLPYLGHRCNRIYRINKYFWGVTKGFVSMNSGIFRFKHDWRFQVFFSVWKRNFRPFFYNTYSSCRKRINSLFLQQQLDDIFPGEHGGNVENIVIVLELERKELILTFFKDRGIIPGHR